MFCCNCEDCYAEEDIPEKQTNRTNRRKCFSLIYYLLLFTYSLAILILALIASQKFKYPSYLFYDIIDNWNQDPIIELVLSDESGNCTPGTEEFFYLKNGKQTLTKWVVGQSVCIKRLKGYSFAKKYTTKPKCEIDEQVCGGIDIETKFCIPKNQLCPINNITLLTKEEIDKLPPGKFDPNPIQISTTLYLVTSRLDELLPISEIRITNGINPCSSSYSDQEIVFKGKECGSKDSRYKRISQLSSAEYANANGVTTITGVNQVGLYFRNYIKWTLECRNKNLLNRALRVERNYDILEIIQFILLILSAINFGLVGCLYGLVGLVKLITSGSDSPVKQVISQVMIFFKVITQVVHSIVLLMVYGYSIDLKIFNDRILRFECSDEFTQSIFQDINDNVISELFHYDLIIFIIFVIFFTVEYFALYIYLQRSIRSNKSKKQKYKGIN